MGQCVFHWYIANTKNPSIYKEDIKNHWDCLDSLPIKDSDVVVGEAGYLCAEYERIAFTAGLKLGAQLTMELAGETSDDQ